MSNLAREIEKVEEGASKCGWQSGIREAASSKITIKQTGQRTLFKFVCLLYQIASFSMCNIIH